MGHQYSSVLTIESVRPSDGGRYSCRPASDAAMTMPEAEVNLHVVNGELREIMKCLSAVAQVAQYGKTHSPNLYHFLRDPGLRYLTRIESEKLPAD